jgi:predicted DNA-binding transcriptional regulator YafY
MEHPTARLLAALEVLQARGWIGADELSRRLEVDRRTVRRYMATLRGLGFPVEARVGREGGYRLRPGFRMPPLMLTDEEALAVVLGLLAGRRIGLAATVPASEAALAKLERVLPIELRESALSLDRTVEFTLQRRRPAPAASPTLFRLGLAANGRHRVQVGYRNVRGELSERQIDPYGLVFHLGRWYLVGWDHRRHELRTFRADRMTTVELTEQTFTPPPGFDSVGEVSRSLASAPWNQTVEVLLETSLDVARRRVPPGAALLDGTPDGVRLRLGVDEVDWAARYLVSLDLPFRVVAPPALRDALRRLAREIEAIAEGAMDRGDRLPELR